ncbi:MAG: TonB-dependent receptor [Bacteroidales bacterium]|nr:TonB-dependent receptor [Bacteroidales bacterium]
MISKTTYLILISLFFSICSFSQTLLIKDAETNEPVADVAIFNEQKVKSALSNSEGEVPLDKFSDDEPIYFQHPSYNELVTTKIDLINMNHVVYLEKKIIEIAEYVISAYRWEQNAKEVPNKITRLSKKEIIFDNPQTTADLLANSNEVFIQKSQLGGGSPMIRGFSSNTVLLVIDGVKMNNAIYREGNLQNIISLDANAVESSEVIFGPGSVTYGSDALGGVMDFHTLRVKLSTSEKLQFSGNAFSRYSSANNEKTGHFDFNVGGSKWGFLSSITYSDYDDLRMGSHNNSEYQRTEYVRQINGVDSIFTNSDPNVQVESGYNQINLMQKLRFRPTKNLDMTYAFHYSKLSDVPRYDRLIQYADGTLKYGDWYYGPQKWMMHALNVKYSKPNLLFDNSKFTIAYQDYEESRHDRRYRSDELTESTENVDAYSLNIDFDKNLKRENQLFYGIEAVYNSVNSNSHTKNISTGSVIDEQSRYPDGLNRYATLAAYLSYKKNFSEKFTTIAGIRANYVSLYSTIDDTSFFDFPFDEISVNNSAVNGSMGFVYRPNEKWQFNLNLSSGFHAPNIDDMAKIFDPEPGTIIVPNENLKPEYAYNVDLGIQKEILDVATLSITGFYTYLTNALVRRDFTFNGKDSIIYKNEMSKVLAIVNADKAYIYGFTASANIELLNNLKLKSVLNYTHGEDQDGIALRHSAPLFGSTRFTYSHKGITASVFADYNGEIKYENLAPGEQDKPYMYATDNNGNPYSPAWWTLNVMTSYNFKDWGTINLGMENILDNRYRPYSSGIVAPGRNLIVGLRANF